MVITSGVGAVPWYTVASKTPFTALASTGKEIYLFSQQTIYVPGKALGNSELQVRSTPKESYAYSIDGAEKINLEMPRMVKLPMPEKVVVKVQFSRIPKQWCQNCTLTTTFSGMGSLTIRGISRLIFSAPSML